MNQLIGLIEIDADSQPGVWDDTTLESLFAALTGVDSRPLGDRDHPVGESRLSSGPRAELSQRFAQADFDLDADLDRLQQILVEEIGRIRGAIAAAYGFGKVSQ